MRPLPDAWVVTGLWHTVISAVPPNNLSFVTTLNCTLWNAVTAPVPGSPRIMTASSSEDDTEDARATQRESPGDFDIRSFTKIRELLSGYDM